MQEEVVGMEQVLIPLAKEYTGHDDVCWLPVFLQGVVL